jgi:hypothetical protein
MQIPNPLISCVVRDFLRIATGQYSRNPNRPVERPLFLWETPSQLRWTRLKRARKTLKIPGSRLNQKPISLEPTLTDAQ